MISSNVVTPCFLLSDVVCRFGGGRSSNEKVSSRSFISSCRVKGVRSFQTLDAPLGAWSLFQKKGLSRFLGRITLGVLDLFQADGGGGGPGGGGGGGGPP